MVGRNMVYAFLLLVLFGDIIDIIGAQYDNCTDGIIDRIQDGWCDYANNNEDCGYDGGDCCECTCINGLNYDCGAYYGFFCRDPNSGCIDPRIEMYPDCTDENVESLGNGMCDVENNNEDCGYDGGDCCECTCTHSECATGDYYCVDPDMGDLEPYICTRLPPTNASCPAAPQREWVVGNTSQARALAKAVQCSGGTFNVTWTGEVLLEETISVKDGTVLNVTNGDANSSVMGDGKNRLFTVVNASLYLTNVVVSNGNALYGGAIAASRSTLTFERVTFDGNKAIQGGGALSLSDGTILSLDKEVVFVNNTAFSGGAIYVTGGSNVLCTGSTTFSENVATSGDGGALYATDGSNLVWTATSQFPDNNTESEEHRSGSGGALSLSGGSSATWNAESVFSANNATGGGGALYLSNGSNATWNAESYFFSNVGGVLGGGALYLVGGSSATWNAESSFSNNSAENADGGALYLGYSSSVTWNAESSFSNNSANTATRGGGALSLYFSSATWNAKSFIFTNRAGEDGGALSLYFSSATWNAKSFIFTNRAGEDGGALCLWGSSATWNAKSFISTNRAGGGGGALSLWSSNAMWNEKSFVSANSAGRDGGALLLYGGSTTWNAESSFSNNSAENANGGALSLFGGSATWNAESSFSNNSAENANGGALSLHFSSATWNAKSFLFTNRAGGDGGALHLSDSSAAWNAESFFSANWAEENGGALYLFDSSNATWSAESTFSANRAQYDGGAVYASQAHVSWNDRALFVSNTARNGGAIFVIYGTTVEWTKQTNFTSNIAIVNGGAVGSRASSTPEQDSIITIKGVTSFANNTCGGNGGGMSLVQSIAVLFESKTIMFSYNSAGVSGGAVFVTGTAFGTVFRNVIFVSNHAPIGGGVRVTESGSALTIDGQNRLVANPTTFIGCKFINNSAFGTGGAVDSASSHDFFDSTLFESNKARVGGALRLAGTASVDNCSFIDNASNLGGGPAIFNIGYISTVTNATFGGNVFDCESQTFLEFKVEDPFTVLCDGCPECVGCSFGGKQRSPTCTSLSDAGIEHASSEGGVTTIEGLFIHKGYWRATNSSLNVHRCFNTKACSGGMTGALGFCLSGYEGPYCSVCSKNYVSSLSFICRKCSDSAVGCTIAAVATGLIAAVGLSIVSYLLATERSDAGRGVVARVTRRLPMQSVKIIIVVWQVLTQFASVSSVTFPNVYQKLLNGVNFLNFDLTWAFSYGCFLEIDFHDRLLWITIPPIVIMVLLGGTYAVAVHRTRESSETDLSNVRQKHVSMALMLTFLVYSSVSSVLFQMFACEDLDDGKRYLRVDYTIDCDSPKHRTFQIYASLMMLVYPLGIPATYVIVLFNNRRMLRDEKGRSGSLVARSTSGLWEPYKPERYYYEVVDCSRRILLSGVVVFIYPDSAAQIAVAVAIAVVFVFVSEALGPFHSPWDAWISRLGHAIVFVSLYLALLLKVDVSGEDTYSQKAFEVTLVAAHGCMVLLVATEAGVMALLLRAGGQRKDPRPRRRRSSNVI